MLVEFVLIINLCTIQDHEPYPRAKCRAMVIPQKSAQACERSRKSWHDGQLGDPPHYFRLTDAQARALTPGSEVIMAAPACSKMPLKMPVAPAVLKSWASEE